VLVSSSIMGAGGRGDSLQLNVFTTTLLTLCFDSFTTTTYFLKVLSMQSSSLGSWFPVILVTVFNAGDMMGRIVSNLFLY